MAHRHSGHSGQSLSHLLAFTPPPRPPPSSGSRRSHSSRGGGVGPALGREQRVHVQPRLRFLLDPTPGRESEYARALAEPDVPVPWDAVAAVAVVSFPPLPGETARHSGPPAPSERLPVCPICLSPPTAPRMARCGHIFCLHCLLHHLSPDPDPPASSSAPASRPSPSQIAKRVRHARSPRHCPVCWDAVYGADLRPVWAWDELEAHSSAFASLDRSGLAGGEQEYACLRLMYRSEGSTVALPLSSSWPPAGRDGAGPATPLPPYTFQPDAVFSRLLRVRPADMLSHLRSDLAAVEQEREEALAASASVVPSPSPAQATPSSTRRTPNSTTPTSLPPGAPVPYAALARKLLGPQAERAQEEEPTPPDPDGTLTFLEAASAMITSSLQDAEATWAAPTGIVHQLAEQARADMVENIAHEEPRPIPPTGFTFYQAVGGAPMYLHPVDHSIVELLTRSVEVVPYMLLVRLARGRKRTLGGQEDTVVDPPLQRRFRTLAPALGSHLLLLHADWPASLLDPHAPASNDAAVYASALPLPPRGSGETIALLPLAPTAGDLAPYRSALKQRQSTNQRRLRAEQLADLHKARSRQQADSELDKVLDPAARVHRHALRQEPPPPLDEADADLRAALALSLRDAGMDVPPDLQPGAGGALAGAEAEVDPHHEAEEVEQTYVRPARGPTTVWGTRAVLADDAGVAHAADGWDEAWGSLAAPSAQGNKKAKGKKAKAKGKVLSLTGGGR